MAAIQGKIAAELAATGSMPLPAGPVQGATGTMIWPVSGPVVSGFGPRTINGSYEYHPGIDIAVPEGTPIRAADGGIVIFTEPEAEQRRLRQLHLHRPRRRALDLLRAPELLRGHGGPVGQPGRDHRLHRLHRLLPRPAPPFRGADRRRRNRPHGLSLAIAMVRQAHTYLVGAMSGATLIAIAIAAFVLLVSAQVFRTGRSPPSAGGDGQGPRLRRAGRPPAPAAAPPPGAPPRRDSRRRRRRSSRPPPGAQARTPR